MATAISETVTPNVGARFPSRLIPGGHSSAGRLPGGKATSATLDKRFWNWQPQDEILQPGTPTAWQAFVGAVLPQPSTRSQRTWLIPAVLADFLAIVLGFTISSLWWQSVGGSPAYSAAGPLALYGAIFTLLGYSERLYQTATIQNPRQERLVLAKAFVWSTLLVIAAFSVSPAREMAADRLAVRAPLSFVLMLAWRKERRRISEKEVPPRSRLRNAMIVGAGRMGRQLAAFLEHDRPRRRVIRGFLDEEQPLGGDIRGRVRDLPRVARRHFVDEIILTVPPESPAGQEAIWHARRNRIDVKVVPELFDFDPAAVTLERFGNVPVLSLCEERIPTFGLLLKRALDVALSAMALLVTAPLLAAIALAIKLDSPGPVFYGATRIGYKGQQFRCWKFRTMAAHADRLKEKLRQGNERQGAFFKIADDPRITRVGRILRRYSLDELPQLWNVLRADMSLVGPRPHPVDDFERYELEHLQRLEVTPGLTGLWQVTARHDPSFERSVALDREYIAAWNLWLDFKILCKTLGAVLRGEGT